MAEKLTEAQRRVLQATADGELLMYFDVWAGYWWTERGKKLPGYGKSDSFPPLPVRALLDAKLVFRGGPERMGSGSHRRAYSLTPAGRLALGEQPK